MNSVLHSPRQHKTGEISISPISDINNLTVALSVGNVSVTLIPKGEPQHDSSENEISSSLSSIMSVKKLKSAEDSSADVMLIELSGFTDTLQIVQMNKEDLGVLEES
eukprot:641848-Ditylum_brightwellii.AAC.1